MKFSSLMILVGFGLQSMLGGPKLAAQTQSYKLYTNRTKPADNHYYTEAQRLRIFRKLQTVTSTTTAGLVVAPLLEKDDTTLFDVDLPPAGKVHTIEDWLRVCETNHKTGISYLRNNQRHKISFADLQGLNDVYKNALKTLQVPLPTLLCIDNSQLAYTVRTIDSNRAISVLSCDLLENVSFATMIAYECHEAAHVLRDLQRKRAGQIMDSNKKIIPIADPIAEEFIADEIAATICGPQQMGDALYDLAIFDNRLLKEYTPAEKETLQKHQLGFGIAIGGKHPGIGIRIQYMEALTMFAKDPHPTVPPEKPPLIMVWRPAAPAPIK